MKAIITATAFLFLCNTQAAFAQTDKGKSTETIILQDNKPSNDIEIEITDGQVYIDGKKVAPYALNRNLKIIKKLNKNLGANGNKDIELNFKNDDLMDGFASNKPMLGVVTKPTTNGDGVLIEEVRANTPAAKAGLQEQDVITKIGNVAITSPNDLVGAIGNYKPGDKVNIQYKRNGKDESKEVELEKVDDDMMGNIFGGPDGGGADMFGNLEKMMRRFGDMNDFKGGFEVFGDMGGDDNSVFSFNKEIASNNQAKLGAQVEDRADNEGVRVVKITEASAAEKAGILIDDVIVNFGGRIINNIDDLSQALLLNKNSKSVDVEVKRAGKSKTIKVALPITLRKKDF